MALLAIHGLNPSASATLTIRESSSPDVDRELTLPGENRCSRSGYFYCGIDKTQPRNRGHLHTRYGAHVATWSRQASTLPGETIGTVSGSPRDLDWRGGDTGGVTLPRFGHHNPESPANDFPSGDLSGSVNSS